MHAYIYTHTYTFYSRMVMHVYFYALAKRWSRAMETTKARSSGHGSGHSGCMFFSHHRDVIVIFVRVACWFCVFFLCFLFVVFMCGAMWGCACGTGSAQHVQNFQDSMERQRVLNSLMPGSNTL